MTSTLSQFTVIKRWPPQHPEVLQLYSIPSPNGVKVSIMLEESGTPYEPHFIDIVRDETWTPEFLSLNPNGKIPAIIDPNGPGGKPIGLFESGAILLYLAEKSSRFVPAGPAARIETIQWVFFQMAAVGPTLGSLAFFHKFGGREWEDKRPRDRYAKESARLLKVLEARLDGRDWIMGAEYTIADMALVGWVRNLSSYYEVGPLVGYDKLRHVPAWLERAVARPATRRALDIPAIPTDAAWPR